MKSFVQTDRARAVDLRTYLRPLDDSGSSFETRDQMLRRSMVDHHRTLWTGAGGVPDERELEELYALGVAGLSAVAGRTQWLGGTPYATSRACCQYNCAYLDVSTVFDLVDTAWLLLNGCGVGFKPKVGTLHGYLKPIRELSIVPSLRSKEYKGREENVETLPCESNDNTWTISIGDSAAAWAKAGGKMFAPRGIRADHLVLDFSEVRGPGGRLKGYGWICNGYEPLARAFSAFHMILNQSAGNLLDEIQIMDVVNWWGTVLSSRRAAEICLLDAHNPRAAEFSRAKNRYWDGNQQRRQSNNTQLHWHKPSKAELSALLHHADECGGDPGICNAEAALNKCGWYSGANPCVPAGTRILTIDGYVPIESRVGIETEVWNGEQWSVVTPAVTGYNQRLVKVSLSDGTSLTCTEAHQWLVNVGPYSKPTEERRQAIALRQGDRLSKYAMPIVTGGEPMKDAYTHGFYCGDGFDHEGKKRTFLYGKKNELAVHLSGRVYKTDKTGRTPMTLPVGMPEKFFVPHGADVPSRLEWLAGVLDSDGTVLQNPNSVCLQIASINKPFLNEVRLLLTTLGVQAKVTKSVDAGDRMLPDGRGGHKLYPCQIGYRLLINAQDTYHLVTAGLRTKRLYVPARMPQCDARRFVEVVSVEPAGVADTVYCFTEPLAHRGTFEGVVTGQCHEILLASKGFCNLVTQCLPRFGRDFSALERSCWLMARANYRQTCVDMNDGILSPAWHQTNAALRLCGVSMTGIVQAGWLTDYQIRRLRDSAVAGAYSMADELGLPRPKAVTTIKPEGTQSKCFSGTDIGDVSEGVHRPLGKYILNWINFSIHDPLLTRLESAGYRVIDNPSDSANALACFPIEYRNVEFSNAAGRAVNQESAVSQLNRYLRWNKLWCDFNVSCTVSYSPDEIPAMAEWLDRHWNDGYIATAFLRRIDPTVTAAQAGHQYLPQEVVTEEDFMAYQSSLRQVDWSGVHGIYDIDSGGCETGACPIK